MMEVLLYVFLTLRACLFFDICCAILVLGCMHLSCLDHNSDACESYCGCEGYLYYVYVQLLNHLFVDLQYWYTVKSEQNRISNCRIIANKYNVFMLYGLIEMGLVHHLTY